MPEGKGIGIMKSLSVWVGCFVGLFSALLISSSIGAKAPQSVRAHSPFFDTRIHQADVIPHVLGKGSAFVQVLLHRDNGLASAALSRIRAKAGWEIPSHRHADADEILYVLDGGGSLTVSGRTRPVSEDMAIWIPRGEEHSFVIGKEGFLAIQIYAPGGPEQRFLKAPKAR